MATGIQEKFSFKQVAMSALSAGFGPAPGANPLITGVNAAVSNAFVQGIGVATGLQKKFDWIGVAAAGVGGAAGHAIGGNPGVARSLGDRIAAAGASAIANAATRSALSGTNFGDNLVAALPDVIAQTLVWGGTELLQQRAARRQVENKPTAEPTAATNGTIGQQAEAAAAEQSTASQSASAPDDIVVTARRRWSSQDERSYLSNNPNATALNRSLRPAEAAASNRFDPFVYRGTGYTPSFDQTFTSFLLDGQQSPFDKLSVLNDRVLNGSSLVDHLTGELIPGDSRFDKALMVIKAGAAGSSELAAIFGAQITELQGIVDASNARGDAAVVELVRQAIPPLDTAFSASAIVRGEGSTGDYVSVGAAALPAIGKIGRVLGGGAAGSVDDVVRLTPQQVKAKIIGTAQQTGNDGAHAFRSYREAILLARNPKVEAVYLNKGYNAGLELAPKTISPNRRPDVLGRYFDGRIDRVEVFSRTDDAFTLQVRNTFLDSQIRARGFTPLQPRIVYPIRK